MFAVSYGVSVAHFLASNGFSDLASLRTAPDKRAVENSPVQMASLKAVIPIVNHALSAGSRISIEGPRYDRYENSNDPNTQGKTAGSVLWDIVLSGDEPHYGVHYAFGMYNALDWRYSGAGEQRVHAAQHRAKWPLVLGQPGREVLSA